ncbi:MAG: c-type cytochrome [Sulfitobacter sp.]|nr:c-type cytochrome [Sulfitobacter sp.]
MKFIKTAALGIALVAGPAFADGHATGDAEAGENLFGKCKACHAIKDAEGEVIVKGGRNGPNLWGVYMRQAGSEEDFAKKYGDSLIEVGESGIMWNEEEFIKYVADPRDYLRETLDDRRARSKMSYKLPKEEDARNVWAYLVSVGPEPEEKSE